MSELERNKEVVRTVLEASDRGDMETVRACFSPDYVDHSVAFGSRMGPSREEAMRAFEEFSRAFAGLHHTVLDLIAEGDKVVLRVSASGSHVGELRGIPPTGRTITMTRTVIYRLRNGQITERWVDAPESLVRQLEQSPPAPEPCGDTAGHEVRVLRSGAVQWHPDPSGGEFWELRLNGVSLTCFRLEAGSAFPAHDHAAEQITLVLEGRLAFELDQDRHVLGPGDAIAIPSGVPHAVTAADGPVAAVDAWSPPPTHLGSPAER